MKNYIIINGKDSRDIQGLLIQSLPPITKPLMRTNQETIDGRDGDIVTKLGYSAYNKEISIGLSYDYDVDEVIQYLNQDGTIIFSNEPERYYRFQMLNQVDFERLIRFKKASVTIHVQPFKFSAVEHTKSFDILTGQTSINLRNNGNIYSKPTYTLTGTGEVKLSLNGKEVFIADLESGAMVLDVENMNAYNPTTKVYLNRFVSGDFGDLCLKTGLNTLSWEGTLTKIEADMVSRWL